MKKIAVPVIDGILCKHFGHCQEFHIFEVNDSNISNSVAKTPPPHAPGVIPNWLGEQGVTDVIAGGMGQRAIDIFNKRGVNVFVGAPDKEAEIVVKDFLAGDLKTQANMCDH